MCTSSRNLLQDACKAILDQLREVRHAGRADTDVGFLDLTLSIHPEAPAAGAGEGLSPGRDLLRQALRHVRNTMELDEFQVRHAVPVPVIRETEALLGTQNPG